MGAQRPSGGPRGPGVVWRLTAVPFAVGRDLGAPWAGIWVPSSAEGVWSMSSPTIQAVSALPCRSTGGQRLRGAFSVVEATHSARHQHQGQGQGRVAAFPATTGPSWIVTHTSLKWCDLILSGQGGGTLCSVIEADRETPSCLLCLPAWYEPAAAARLLEAAAGKASPVRTGLWPGATAPAAGSAAVRGTIRGASLVRTPLN